MTRDLADLLRETPDALATLEELADTTSDDAPEPDEPAPDPRAHPLPRAPRRPR